MIAAIVGPSGAGKDTLIAAACRLRPDLRLVRRVITRPSGAGGEDFEGVTEDEFERRRALGDFALCWQAHALSYGIPKAQLLGPGTILFNGSRAILSEALRSFPDLRVILVTAPDAVLARRLSARGRETEADIAARLARAGFSLPDGIIAETVVNDGTVEAGASALLAALQPVRA
jgi:ribose 1,5-bisphosphokinase